MADLERIRDLYPDARPPSPDARRRARLVLAERIDRKPRVTRRSLLPVVGLAVGAAVAATALIGVGDEASVDARAAAIMRRAALNTKGQELPGTGRVLYVKSVDAYLATWAEAGFSVLVPHVREIWVGPERGLLDTSTGEPKFLSDRDRRRWIAAGRPNVREPDTRPTAIPHQEPSTLPATPDALFAHIENQARGHSEGTYRQMFTLVGDAFRETNLTAGQRAALYEVVARIPGVDFVGNARDSVGRRGVAVAMDHPDDGIRETLVIDPKTGTLLAEQDVTLANNSYGYPAGTVVGHSTYLERRMVAAVGS